MISKIERESVKDFVYLGYTIQYNDVCITDLRRHHQQVMHHARAYQVYSKNFTKVYKDIDEATDKFFELKSKKK